MASQQDLAFSNPIYEHMGPIPAANNRDFRPIPKPRLSKNKPPTSSAAARQKDIEDSPSLAMNPILMQNLNRKSTILFQGDDSKRSSSLCLGDIRMTQLLEEINSLTDSLQKNYSSAPDNVDQCDDHHDHDHQDHHQDPSTPKDQAQAVMDGSKSKSKDLVPRRTIKRKRIPVRSDLLTMSFDDQEKISSSPEVEKTKNNPVTSSADSGVFLMASQKSVNDDDQNNNSGVDGSKATIAEDDGKPEPEPSERGPEPPKLPPRKPLRLEIVPKMDPIKSFEEQLIIDHLHNDTLSLQRSGYLWKTGPNYKSFKNRWCVLYRHSHNYFDANVSYYFNRSSMSASLSGKILLAEIECISIAETIPAKTRLPKIEKVYHTHNNNNSSNSSSGSIHSKTSRDTDVSSSTNTNTNTTTTTTASSQTTSKTDGNNQSLCFMDIGVKSRQGRVYLFAARSDPDRQQWIHAFVQAITLHAFKNKEIYQCGFIRAKFTITAMWQNCFAILTTDRFFYLFELDPDNPIPTLDCQHYHTFNLRKTVRLSCIRENSMIPATPASPTEIDDSVGGVGGVGRRKSTDSWTKEKDAGLDCRFGFSLTQNGGDVVYLWSIFEQHINLWYKNIWRFWLVPKQPAEKLILEEQYLTKDDVPVAFDKCIKFLDTFNQTGLNLFGPMQDSINETVISKESSNISSSSSGSGSGSGSDKSFNNGSFKARVPFLPSHPSRQMFQNGTQSSAIMPSDMDLLTQQKLLQQLRFDSWNVHLLPQKYNACQISQLLLLYLRSMNECLFTETLLPYWIKLSSLADKVVESPPVQDPTGKPNTPANGPTSNNNNGYKNEQIKRLLKLMPPVNYFTLRRIIIYLYNATENKEEEYHLSTSLCKTLFFSKQNKTINSVAIARSLLLAMIQNHVWLFDVTQDELEKELQIKRVVNLIISQNRKESAKKHPPGHHRMKMIRSRNTTTNTNNNNNNDNVWSNNNNNNNNKSKQCPSDGQKVNSLILSIKVMITVDKQQNVNVHINRNTTANDLFDMIFEKVKPENPEEMLNNYSVFEVNCARRLERIVMGKERILPLVLHWSNWPSHWSSDACIEIKSTDQLLKSQARNVKVKLPNLNIIRFENDSLNYMPTMLMSVIRYCGQNDTRLVKHILAEFSSSQLFLYCKETHHLLGQFGLDDIYWYVGCETGNIIQYGSVKCSSIVNDDDHDVSGVSTGGSSSKSKQGRAQQQQSTTTTMIGSDPAIGSNQAGTDYNHSNSIPALTFIERHRIKSRQSQDRRNFGHTLMFNSWTELDQWIKGLLEASYYKELFAI